MNDVITAEWLNERLSAEWGLQSTLADFMGLDKTKMNKMVKGTRLISQAEAEQIRRFFEVRKEKPHKPDEDGFRIATASRLKEAREAAGYATASVAATHLGMGSTTYKHHENGTRGIKPLEAVKYAEAYQVSLDWLYTGKGSMMMTPTHEKIPQDALRSVHAILRTFNPDVKLLLLEEEECAALKEAIDIYCRLYGADPEKAKSSRLLGNLFPRGVNQQ